jgi:NADPH-dependent 2,4-dienoyl-CoA reductase/sulfur reductase-like enzyme
MKRVVIVGAGVAGHEAARIAAMCGHRVTRIERECEVRARW